MQNHPTNKNYINHDAKTIKRLEKESCMRFNELVSDMDYDIDNGNFNANYVDYSDRF